MQEIKKIAPTQKHIARRAKVVSDIVEIPAKEVLSFISSNGIFNTTAKNIIRYIEINQSLGVYGLYVDYELIEEMKNAKGSYSHIKGQIPIPYIDFGFIIQGYSKDEVLHQKWMARMTKCKEQ